MSAGLEASTVTPGSTAPDASFTVPTIPCADTTVGARTSPTTIRKRFDNRYIVLPPRLQIHPRPNRTLTGFSRCTRTVVRPEIYVSFQLRRFRYQSGQFPLKRAQKATLAVLGSRPMELRHL